MTLRRYKIFLAAYALRNYERALAKRELCRLVPDVRILSEQGRTLVVETTKENAAREMERLAFFSGFQSGNNCFRTHQNKVEALDPARDNSRNIRYFMHSLHEYKGRFYPQLCKSLMNITGGGQGVALDPFCGCGTLLLEATLNRVPAVGVDINPVGWLITHAKIAGTRLGNADIDKIHGIFSGNLAHLENKYLRHDSDISGKDKNYLNRWFPCENLQKLLVIDKVIQSSFAGDARIFLSAVLSSILRIFSFQSPGEQRIRRRKDTPPSNVYEVFTEHLLTHLHKIRRIRNIVPPIEHHTITAHLGDARAIPLADSSVDCAVTSPPYATALPYIDADRLSLFFMAYADKRKFRELERAMIGSREISAREKAKWEAAIIHSPNPLPGEVTELLAEILQKNKNAQVGFRRKNTAALLCRYFFDMREALVDLRRVLKPAAQAALVVGDNSTVAGGDKIEIPTARFINLIAEQNGFRLRDVMPMTITTPYNIYSKNAIRREFISFLEVIK